MSSPIFVFDAYGTLFDVHAAIGRYRAMAGPEADRFSEIWRAKQLEYTWTLTLAGRYEPFWTLTQRALDYAFDRVPSVDRALRGKLLDCYLKLDAFADSRPVLAELKRRGERTAILSNGSPQMLASAVEAAGFKSELDAVLSVNAIKMYKPRPQVYARLQKIADMMDQANAEGCTADEAEARAMEQIQKLGGELLGDWASEKQQQNLLTQRTQRKIW